MRFPEAFQCEGQTPSMHLSPLGVAPDGIAFADELGHTFYARPGWPAPIVPTPNHKGRWHFAKNIGGIDYPGNCAGNQIRWAFRGDGALVVTPIAQFSPPDPLTVKIFHHIPGVGAFQCVPTILGAAGDTFTAPVSSHGHSFCNHWIDLDGTGPFICGHRMYGYAGADWTAMEIEPGDDPSFAMRGSGSVRPVA